MKKLIVTVFIAATLSGCAVQAKYYGVSGSKADGTVSIGYDGSSYTITKQNLPEAQQLAAAKCRIWGFTDAEAFGGVKTQRVNEYAYQGIIEFQCK